MKLTKLTKTQRSLKMASMETLGDLLSAWRDLHGHSQADAARLLNWSREQYRLVESGESVDLRLSTINRLTTVTGIARERILGVLDLQLGAREKETVA